MAKRAAPAPGLSKGCRGILQGLKAADVRVFASVTDTYIGNLIQAAEADRFFATAKCCSEEEALGVAVGASLAGKRAACIFQNAGLFSSGRGVALAQNLHAPVLILVSHRGDHRDPVYFHAYKGKLVEPFLEALGVHYAHADRGEPLAAQVARGAEYVRQASQPFALLLSRGDLT